MTQTRRRFLFPAAFFLLVLISAALTATWQPGTAALSENSTAELSWTALSSANGDIPNPSGGTEQTAALVLDVDKDGLNDIVLTTRNAPGPSVIWYRRHSSGWERLVIDSAVLPIEAGGAFQDIDQDGDLDIVMGGDFRSNQVWWWENPYPNYPPNGNWTRRLIKDSGQPKHHDQILGNFDNDPALELAFWNQRAKTLYLAEVPADPRNAGEWPLTSIYSWSTDEEHEGLAKADIDGDGLEDLVGGGRWFKYNGSGYDAQTIDVSQAFSRAAVGQFKPGGRPEVVFVIGDGVGRLKFYEWVGSQWLAKDLLGFDVDHGHSLEVGDVNGDGDLDIFVAEMRLNGGNADAKMWLLLGDGQGSFEEQVLSSGIGNHESRLADLDGDGDLDILGKPYNWDTPRLDIWLNDTNCTIALDNWQRHLVDGARPERAIFVLPGDLDGDGLADIASGAWWYRNPGTPSGTWQRNAFDSPLNNIAAIHDFDGDGHLDVLGTQGVGSANNAQFAWGHNDGSGNFTIYTDIGSGQGDFLQGVAVDQFTPGGPTEVMLSWHNEARALQALTVPANPRGQQWTIRDLSPPSQGEQLTAADIDRDNDVDLLLGTRWLENQPAGSSDWADASRRFRAAVTVTAVGFARQDMPVEVPIDFSVLLSAAGGSGSFNTDALRVVEVTAARAVLNDAVPFQLDPDPGFDPATNAAGDLIILMEGQTTAGTERYYDVYFDVLGGPAVTPIPVVDRVVLTDNVPDAGQSSYQIETSAATYFYHKDGGGFASLVDSDGNDWINHSDAAGSAGDFRGIPNLVYPADGGYFHPGRDNVNSVIAADGPLRATIRSTTADQNWETEWEILPNFARLTVQKAAGNYWFLYEGTPGGLLEPATDFVVRSDGTQTAASQSWTGDLPGAEWVYFSDPGVGRSLFFAHHTQDTLTDSYYPMEGAMTVFGFGRQNTNRFLTQTPKQFTMGFVEATAVAAVGAAIDGAYQPLSATIGTPEMQDTSGGSASWGDHTLFNTSDKPDRNRMADINGDGRLDAVVGYEAINVQGKLAWYEQPANPTTAWTEHLIANVVGPMSLDVADMDGDGDQDVIVGEHNYTNEPQARLIVYANPGSGSGPWTPYVVHTGDEHHDGAQLVDIDDDGDLDAISIGWRHSRVLLYENASTCPSGVVPATAVPTIPVATATDTPQASDTPSAANTATNTPSPVATSVPTDRVTTGLEALYTFDHGAANNTVYDVSGNGSPLNLAILSGSNTSWLPGGGLALNGNSRIASAGAATKIIDAAVSNGALTVEVWISPRNVTQDGPARIVSLSSNANSRNLTLGQGRWGTEPASVFDLRLRTTATDSNGRPSLTTATGTAQVGLQHVVATYSNNGQRRIYIDGVPVTNDTPGGTLASWDSSMPLNLGNEADGSRPWLGDLHLAAFYSRALSAAEVSQNFAVGPDGQGSVSPPTATATNAATATNTPEFTPTNTAVPTATNTPEFTPTNTAVPTATNTPEFTPTNTVVPTATNTPEFTPTATAVSGNAVVSLSLIDVATNQPVAGYGAIADGAVIDLNLLGLQEISIRANTSPAEVGSVIFTLDGAKVQTENILPYALAGDGGGAFNPWNYSLGSHTLQAVPYSERRGGGTAGQGLTISFTLVRPTSATATNTPQFTPTNTPVPTATNTPQFTPTNTAVPTATNTPEFTPTNTPIPTATNTPEFTPTNTGVPTATNTPEPTATPEEGACVDNPNNVLANPGFESGLSGWRFYTNGQGSSGTGMPAYECDNAARLTFTSVGSNMQFYQTNFTLKANTAYRFSFAAHSSSGHDVQVYLHQHTSPYTRYGIDGVVFDLDSGWREYSYTFTTTGFTGTTSNTRLRFWYAGLAAAGDVYWLDNVQLQEVDAIAPTNTAVPTATNTPAFTATNTSVPTVTNTPQFTPTNTSAPTATNTPQSTPTNTAVPTATNTPEFTPTNTAVPTATNTPEFTPTNTAVPTATNTPEPTGSARITTGLVALYTFEQGSASNIVRDVSGAGAPLDLTIASGSDTAWLSGGGLALNGSSRIASPGAATKIMTAVENGGALTVEAWITPRNVTQDGPARIVTLSNSATYRNLTLAQGRWGTQPPAVFDFRLRTTASDNNGQPSLGTSPGTAQVRAQHVVATYSNNGQRRIYIDGTQVASDIPGGTLSNWDSTLPLILGNEADGTRPWLGDLHLVAFYGRALSADEVGQNFAAGINGTTPSPPTATSTPAASVTPTNTPVPDGGGSPTELLVFDWDKEVTVADRGFPWNQPPLASANGDWTSPVNFAQGTLFYRVEIDSQPEPQDMRLQFCFWQNKDGVSLALENCGPMTNVRGTPGTVATWSVKVENMWKKNNEPIEWERARARAGVAIKNSAGLPVSDFSNWIWNGEDPNEWYPLDMRFTVVVVAKDAVFSGWQNYIP